MYDMLKKPVFSEKSSILENVYKYTLVVSHHINKKNIVKMIRNMFNMNVVNANTINVKKKLRIFRRVPGYRKGFKKIIVTVNQKLNYNKIF